MFGPLTALHELIVLGTHFFYWHWSAASLVLMLAFSSAALISEALRMWFVFILHKKTFG